MGIRGLELRGLEGFRFRGSGLRGLGVQRLLGLGFEFGGSGVLALKFSGWGGSVRKVGDFGVQRV